MAVEPTEGSLDDPAFGDDGKVVCDFLTDVNGEFPRVFQVFDKGFTVPLIGADGFEPGKFGLSHEPVEGLATCHGVVLVGGVDVDAPKIALGINQALAASPLDFLASMEAPLLSFVVGLDALGVDDQITRRKFAPFFCRDNFTNRWLICSHTPRCFMRLKWS